MDSRLASLDYLMDYQSKKCLLDVSLFAQDGVVFDLPIKCIPKRVMLKPSLLNFILSNYCRV